MSEQIFEKALQRLEEIVAALEQGQLPLEESLQIYEEGLKLAKFCGSKLEKTEKRIKTLIKDGDHFYLQDSDEV